MLERPADVQVGNIDVPVLMPDEVHDVVPRIVRHPDSGQSSPSVFFGAFHPVPAIRCGGCRASARKSVVYQFEFS